jgi:hypothetical protein
MTEVFEIALSPFDQRFVAGLGENLYNMTIRWCDALEGSWILDISSQEDEPIVHGIAVVGGVDLLGQYRYLNIGGGGFLYAVTDGQPLVPPTRENLGLNAHLLWQPFV